MLATVNGQ